MIELCELPGFETGCLRNAKVALKVQHSACQAAWPGSKVFLLRPKSCHHCLHICSRHAVSCCYHSTAKQPQMGGSDYGRCERHDGTNMRRQDGQSACRLVHPNHARKEQHDFQEKLPNVSLFESGNSEEQLAGDLF